MIGFLRGILLGGVVAAGGLVAASQLAGPVTAPGADQANAGGTAPEASNGTVSSDARATPPFVLDASPAAQGSAAPSVAPALPAAENGDAPSSAALNRPTVGLEGDTPATAAVLPAEPPATPSSTAPEEGAQGAPVAAPTGALPGASDASGPMVQTPAAPVVPGAEPAPAAAQLPPAQTARMEEALLQPGIATAPEAVPEVQVKPATDGGAMEMAPPTIFEQPARIPEASGTLVPTPGLGGQMPGVVTGRLPRIAAAAPEAVADQAPASIDPTDLPPLQRYARAFAGAEGKPLFAILLEDTGADDVNRAELGALSLPLTIVIDPLSEGAADRAAIWRAAGQEVVMAATGIPSGATAADLEQTFQVLAEALPETVAVIDPDGAAFQDNRPLAAQVVPILAGQGRGLVTFDRGLNAADQVARREGLGAAVIFRRLDGAGEEAPVIRRYLDRAAFKAAQDGRVTVIGTLRPETVAAILEWAVEGKSATVALAPISALMAP